MINGIPKCCETYKACFARLNGLCMILEDTDFNNKPCPFQKENINDSIHCKEVESDECGD